MLTTANYTRGNTVTLGAHVCMYVATVSSGSRVAADSHHFLSI